MSSIGENESSIILKSFTFQEISKFTQIGLEKIKFGPRHDKTNKMACALAKDPSFLHADSEDSDQIGRMPRLIRVFAERTFHFVGFVMRQLI